jgi:large subunit ribosomal protein L17
MRHLKHRHQLNVKKEHREAMMASLASALFTHGRIQTTLAKAKALRPYAEKVITYSKKAALSEDKAVKLHYRRLAIATIRDVDAVAKLFNERASEFVKRPGGYTRIYKLGARIGDAAEIAIIELIAASDEGYKKSAKKAKPAKKAAGAKKSTKAKKEPKSEEKTEEAAAPAEASPAQA